MAEQSSDGALVRDDGVGARRRRGGWADPCEDAAPIGGSDGLAIQAAHLGESEAGLYRTPEIGRADVVAAVAGADRRPPEHDRGDRPFTRAPVVPDQLGLLGTAVDELIAEPGDEEEIPDSFVRQMPLGVDGADSVVGSPVSLVRVEVEGFGNPRLRQRQTPSGCK